MLRVRVEVPEYSREQSCTLVADLAFAAEKRLPD